MSAATPQTPQVGKKPEESAPRLVERARRLKTRRLLTGIARSTALTLTGLFLGVCAIALVTPFVSTALGAWLLLAGAVIGVSAGGYGAARHWQRTTPVISLPQAARRLGAEDEDLARLLSTGIDLAHWGEDGAKERGAAYELVAAQVREAEAFAAKLGDKSTDRSVGEPSRTIQAAEKGRGEFLSLFASVAVFTLLVLIGPQSFFDSLTAVTGTRPPAPVLVGNLKITTQPPAHTGLAMEVAEGSSGEVRAYPGSRIVLEGRLSHPVDRGELLLPRAQLAALTVHNDSFRAEWVARDEGLYRLRFWEEAHEVESDFAPRRTLLLEDALPTVSLESPEGDIEAVTSQTIYVAYSAVDDFGLEKLELVLQGDEEVRITLSTAKGRAGQGGQGGERGAREHSGEYELLPAAYPQLGNGAYLRVDAWDNDLVSGPKVGSSPSVYVSFLSVSSMREEIEGLEERLLEALLTYLADHLEYPGGKATNSTLDRTQQLRQSGTDLLALLKLLIERVQKGEEEGLFGGAAVVNIETGLKREIAQWHKNGGVAQDLVKELESDILFIDRLLRELRMEQALSLGDELSALQNDLFNRIQQGEDLEALKSAVSRIQELLRAMSQKLSNSAEMPDGFANSDAAKKPPEDSLARKLKELTEALEAGDRERAAKLAEEIMEELAQWLDKLDEAADMEMKGETDPISQALDELGADIQAAISEQERIMGQTRRIADDATARALEKLEELMNAFKQLQRERLAVIGRETTQMQNLVAADKRKNKVRNKPRKATNSPHSGDMLIMETRRELSRLLRQVDQDLERGFRDTLESAGQLHAKLVSFDQKVADALEDEKLTERGSQHGATALAAAQAIIDDLEGLLAKRKESIDSAGQVQLQELSEDEGKLAQNIDEITQRLKALAEESPLVDPALSEPAESAGKSSRGAGGELGRGDPYGALPKENAVIESLAQLSNDMEKMREKMDGSGKDGGQKPGSRRRNQGKSGGKDVDRSHVEIPAETEAREWREFREEVMKAMREGEYPRDYEREVRRYYEGLIR